MPPQQFNSWRKGLVVGMVRTEEASGEYLHLDIPAENFDELVRILHAGGQAMGMEVKVEVTNKGDIPTPVPIKTA